MGDLTWPVIRDLVDGVITVSEQEIVDAMQLLFERMKVIWPDQCTCILRTFVVANEANKISTHGSYLRNII